MSSWWTAIGAMLVPLGVILVLEAPSEYWDWVALCLIIGGFISFIFGWKKALADEKQKRKEGIVFLYILTSIAEKLGVNVDDAVNKLKEIVNGK